MKCPNCLEKELCSLKYGTNEALVCLGCHFYVTIDTGCLTVGKIKINDPNGYLKDQSKTEKATSKVQSIPTLVGDYTFRSNTTIAEALKLAKVIREEEYRKVKLVDLSAEMGGDVCVVYASNHETTENPNPIWDQKAIDEWKDLW